MRQRYVIAVKREKRAVVCADWVAQLASVDGVTVAGASSSRAVIECEPIARDQVERMYGDLVHIEPVIEHEPSEREPSEPALDRSTEKEPEVP